MPESAEKVAENAWVKLKYGSVDSGTHTYGVTAGQFKRVMKEALRQREAETEARVWGEAAKMTCPGCDIGWELVPLIKSQCHVDPSGDKHLCKALELRRKAQEVKGG